MLSQLQQAFKGMIDKSDWTDRVTRQVTALKVDAIKAEIGYPKIFETPDELDKLFENVSANIDYFRENLRQNLQVSESVETTSR